MHDRNEYYEGQNLGELERISAYLERARAHVPEKFSSYANLADMASRRDDALDWDVFYRLLGDAESLFSRRGLDIDFMPFDRYYVTNPEPGSIGGFYGRPAGGYYYFNDLGFCTLVNEEEVPSRVIRTIEFTRGYLHDSIHASTFRTFRIDPEGNVYRHRYGINVRNADGTSYSAYDPDNTNPETINLNLLMDGLVQKSVNDVMKWCARAHFQIWTERSVSMMAELRNKPLNLDGFPEAQEYHERVLKPVNRFMKHWAPGPSPLGKLDTLILQSMMDGDLGRLEQFFGRYARKDGKQAWADLFKQPAYVAEPPARMYAESGASYASVGHLGSCEP